MRDIKELQSRSFSSAKGCMGYGTKNDYVLLFDDGERYQYYAGVWYQTIPVQKDCDKCSGTGKLDNK